MRLAARRQVAQSIAVHRHIQGTSGRMIRALLAAVLLLNAGTPAMPAANATPAAAGQSHHAGHDMSDMPDMVMDVDSAGQPATDCCDDGSMNCPCGCVVSQPGAPHFIATIRAHEAAPESAIVLISRRASSPIASPFRPPA